MSARYQVSQEARALFLSIFCYSERDFSRQEGEWEMELKGENPDDTVLSFKHRASFGSMSMVARAFAVLLLPRQDLVPFYIPDGIRSFEDRPFTDFRGMFFPDMNMRLKVFSAELLLMGYKSLKELDLVNEKHVARYEALFEDALSVLDLRSDLSARLRKLQEQNSKEKERLQVV